MFSVSLDTMIVSTMRVDVHDRECRRRIEATIGRSRTAAAYEELQIVAEYLEPGASESLSARRPKVNANMLFT
jgi:hypothetical protein